MPRGALASGHVARRLRVDTWRVGHVSVEGGSTDTSSVEGGSTDDVEGSTDDVEGSTEVQQFVEPLLNVRGSVEVQL